MSPVIPVAFTERWGLQVIVLGVGRGGGGGEISKGGGAPVPQVLIESLVSGGAY